MPVNPSATPLAAANMARTSELDRAQYLRALVREHFSSVWRFLRCLGFEDHVVDDAAQDLFFVVARRVDDIVPGRELAFLLGAALKIATKLRHKRAREVPIEDFSVAVEETTATPETLLDEERARRLLYRLVSEIDERFRVVFVLYELEGMTMPEISEVLDVPMGTVASRLRSARDAFRVRLERHRACTRNEKNK